MKLFSGLFGGRPKPQPIQRLPDEEDISEAEEKQRYQKKQARKKTSARLGLTGGPLGDTSSARTSRAPLT